MYKVYEVTFGDTLDSIAKKFNITNYELKKLNNINMINPGELLVVPNYSNDEVFETYIIKRGDTLSSIARRYHINLNDLVKINGLDIDDYIYPEQQILVPRENVNVLVTQKDDTLESISNRLGISINDLLLENSIIYLLPDQIIMYKNIM